MFPASKRDSTAVPKPLIDDKAIAETIIAKHEQALSEHEALQAALLDLYEKSRINMLSLRDLAAAGRVFGLELEVPDKNARVTAQDFYVSPAGRAYRLAQNAELPAPVAPASVTPAAMPRIRDVVLDRLKAAAEKGTRAAPIRDFIKQAYGRDIHEKTVGMTLYRLSKESPPQAHRIGIQWFFGPDNSGTKNPGAETPGLKDLLG